METAVTLPLVVIQNYDRDGEIQLTQQVVSRFGVFGVGRPIDADAKRIPGWTIYHLPTNIMLVPWACTSQGHVYDEVRALRDRQHHARAWTSSDLSRLRRDGRIKEAVAILREHYRPACCRTLTHADIYP